jgi:hypothetical protein
MDLYTATININSNNHHQVVKTGLTATEIAVLQAIHNDPKVENVGGAAPITNIAYVASVDRSDDEERKRLTGEGDDGLGVPLYRMDLFRKAFPNDFIPLPQFVPGMERKTVPEYANHPGSLANLKPTPKKVKADEETDVLE